MFEYVPTWLMATIWPLKETKRIRTKEMKVLCLGLGRTGTESLRTALVELGYSDVYHGFRVVMDDCVGDTPQWWRVQTAKYSLVSRDPKFLNREEFDKVLGQCEATTDLPGAALGVDLLRAYPNAKVILNRRRDIESWYQSQLQTIDKLYQDWPSWITHFFYHETFWLGHLVYTVRMMTDFDFAKNGKQFYHDHYAALEAECRKQNRPYLDWVVQDGWEPLCDFLGHEVPDKEFPNSNTVDGFEQKRIQLHGQRNQKASRNATLAGIALTTALILSATWLLQRS